MNKKILILIIAIIAIIAIAGIYFSGIFGDGGSDEKGTIIVLMGNGFSNVGEELITAFNKKYPNIEVNPVYGGSGQLFATLKSQHSGDVFVPADYSNMEDAMNEGFMVNDTVKNITKNVPTIAVEKGNPKNIHSLEDLAKPGVRVGIGEDGGPAIGTTTAKILNKTNLTDKVTANVVVTGSTVNQLLTYLVSGQVDATIIWRDMVSWEENAGKIEAVNISEDQNIISTVPMGLTNFAGDNKDSAEKFLEFINSDEGKKIWEKWGYETIS